jgi:TonB-linked SusC/RagA family outer membrane protein
MKRKRKNWMSKMLFRKVVMLCFLLSGMAVTEVFAAQIPDKMNVSGIVRGEKGESLIGVAVRVQGKSIGTVTDVNGKFSLKDVEKSAILDFTYIGMNPLSVPVNGKSNLTVTMQEAAFAVNEVVVVGYGSVKKSDLTGSVASVKTEALKSIPANSIEGLLQGRAAGLQVINSSQDPGAAATVRIRGNSSLNGSNAPLIVVDGFPLGDAGDLKQINPADIVSMEILKDASASAIYGSRGANGVIMVTTRKGKTGTTTVTIRQQTTLSKFNSKLNLWRDPVLMASLSNESRINGGYTPYYTGETNSFGVYYPSVEELATTWKTNTRWDDIVFRKTPVSNNTTVTVASSGEKTSFNLSANYYTDNGVYIKDDYLKGGYNFSIEHNLYSNFKIRFSNILSRGARNNNGGLAYWRNPIWPVYDAEGNYYLTSSQDYSHPLAITDLQKNKSKTLDVLSSAVLEWQILSSLKLTSQLNYKYGTSMGDQYYPTKYTEAGTFNNGYAVISNWDGQNLVSESYANFNKTFNKHTFSAMLGYSYEYYLSRSTSLTAMDFVNETLQNEDMSSGNPQKNIIDNGFTETKLVSGISRFNYEYDNKYLLTLTARTDGSSKFGKNNKWALFPSGAVSWKAHEEAFIKKLNVFDELKVRLSYGVSGNQGISPYQTLSKYGTGKYFDNGSWVTTIGPGYITGMDYIYSIWGGIPNPDLKWESTAQTDIGLDMAFFKRRLRVTLDFYDKETSDLLRERNLPVSSGYNKMWVNDGKIQNKGVEVTIDGNILNTKDWQVSGTLILAKNNNKMVSLGNTVTSGLLTDPNTGMKYEYAGSNLEMFRGYTNVLAVGQPMNAFYGYKTDGIIQTLADGIKAGLTGDMAKPGEYKYVDLNKDGVVDDNDRTILGSPNPKFTGSLSLNVSWKKFDFSIFFNGAFGQKILDTQAFNQPGNMPLRWTPDNPTNAYPSLRDGRLVYLSDWWVKDGSYVRLQNMSIGYTFDLPKKYVLNKARLYVNGSNIYTFTKFKGYDPEVGMDGVYWGGYPRLSKWTVGLDLTF